MSLDPIEFRNTLGSFATGICVIAAHTPEGKPFGMTVNSFASVSLDPALVLWSLQNNSECYPAFEQADAFSVNILASDQEAVSNCYAKKGEHLLAKEDFSIGSSGAPILNGVVTSFECSMWARYPGGDHIILVGEVQNMTANPDKKPLLFHKGKYELIA